MIKQKTRNQILQILTRYQNLTTKPFFPGKSRIQYAGAYYGKQELALMIDVLLDGWFGLGKRGELLERRLTKFIGANSTLLTNSGSSASLLCMAALKSNFYADRIEPGSEIITPSCTFATTVAAIVNNGFVPVFVDVDLETFNVNPNSLSQAVSKKTRAVFLPHTLGNPNEMDAIMDIAKKFNLHVIEDNCDALGSEYDGKKTGSFGVLATCSFYPAHHMTLAGEGGAIFINDLRLQRVILTLRNWGRGCWCSSLEKNSDGACRNRFNFSIDNIPIDHKYFFLELGYNLKPVELQAAMGLAQLRRFPKMAKARRENFAKFYNFFKNFENFFVLPKSSKKADPCWFSFPLTLRDNTPFTRREITTFLEKNKIETRTVFAGNILRQPAMRRVFCRKVGDLKNSDKILKDTFFIGVWPGITELARNYIMEMFSSFLKKY